MRSSSMKKIRVGVSGAGGRMGQEIARLLAGSKELEPFFGLDPQGVSIGFTHAAKSLNGGPASSVDVWIDFSSPEAFDSVLAFCVKHGIPLVSGTTGLSVKSKGKIKTAARKIPVLWASNMSLGVAVLNEALKVFANLKDFDFQVEEVHHRRKKDRPSGTALTLQENLTKVVGKSLPEPVAIRGGGVYGIHKIWAISDEEFLLFEHTALNRAVFAKGAVRAAAWMIDRKPGVYAIRDLLLKNK